MQTQSTTNNTPAATTAVVLWDDEAIASVRDAITAGRSVSKALAKAAPKGFIHELRVTRSNELTKNTSALLGGLRDRGFTIKAMTEINTSAKTGVSQVTLRMATPKPTSKMTIEEFMAAEKIGSVEELRGRLNAPVKSANPK